MNFRPPVSMTLSEAVIGFVNHKFAKGVTERSVSSYERLLNKWIENEGNKKINDVQTSLCIWQKPCSIA